MTASLRTLAFGDLGSPGVWGAAWMPAPADEAVLALGSGEQGAVVAGDRLLSVDCDDSEWNLDGTAAKLVVAPAGELVAVCAPGDGIEGWTQLCHVSGRFARDGTDHVVDCLGLRTWFSPAVDLERYDSVRAVSAWFEPDEAMALTAFRPRKAKSHDKDVLAAAVIATAGSAGVEDPRLSTTYDAAGWPARAGLELWLTGEEPERQYQRRASGEAIGARVQASTGAIELRAEPFRWHSRGRDGAGMYLFAHRG